jgi:DNA modification methylase
VETLRAVFAEVRRVLRPDGVLWLDLGDTYDAGGNYARKNPGTVKDGTGQGWNNSVGRTGGWLGAKQLMGMPWRVAFALQADGWILRNAVIWAKPNAMPESVTDRLSTRYEHVFLFSRSRRYWFDLDPIREPLLRPEAGDGSRIFGGARKAGSVELGESARRTGSAYFRDADNGRNPGDVWTIPTQPYPAAHFATFPPELARRCIAAGCPPDGTVLDPFAGSGTTLMVARRLLRKSVGIELNPAYCELIVDRIGQPIFDFGEATA